MVKSSGLRGVAVSGKAARGAGRLPQCGFMNMPCVGYRNGLPWQSSGGYCFSVSSSPDAPLLAGVALNCRYLAVVGRVVYPGFSLHSVDHVLYSLFGRLMVVGLLWILACVMTSIGILVDSQHDFDGRPLSRAATGS